jgi:hypothetical protein
MMCHIPKPVLVKRCCKFSPFIILSIYDAKETSNMVVLFHVKGLFDAEARV